MAGYRARAQAAGQTIERVIAIYEAGWSGFWLARWLAGRGVEAHVVQPSSVPVDRRSRRAKSDGIDAELLLRTLLAWLRGEPRVSAACSQLSGWPTTTLCSRAGTVASTSSAPA